MRKSQWEFHPKFVLRTPMNSFQKDVDASLFKESLYLASFTLHSEYEKTTNNLNDGGRKSIRLETSIYKYKTRAKNRCTPFGLFAGVSVGEWKNSTTVLFDTNFKKTLARNTRIDTDVLYSLAMQIEKLPTVRQFLKYYPNTSLYCIGNYYRYAECHWKNGSRFYTISKVDRTLYLARILEHCAKGLTISEMCKLLVSEDIPESDALLFIEELLAAQIIVNELEPSTTGPCYFDYLKKYLREIQYKVRDSILNELIIALDEITDRIKALDENIVNPIAPYQLVFDKLKKFLPKLKEQNLFHAVLYKRPIYATLNSNIQGSLEKALQFLIKICPASESNTLEGFKQRFYERFNEEEVPLLLALDSEMGIGYPERDNNGVNDLIDDVIFPNSGNSSNKISWNKLQTVLHKLLTDATKQNKKILKINPDDFEGIDYSSETLPATFSIIFKVLDSVGNKIEISSVGGNSAANLLSRFTQQESELNEILNDIVKYEEKVFSEQVLAEVVHLPDNRAGNILVRPSLRNYEIPYMGISRLDDECKIKARDLFLRLSGNRLVLFDKRLNKEVIPRLSSAHNYKFNSLPVYHFLCNLQNQYFDRESITFPWGILANLFEFLPRVEFDNVVLSPATWQIVETEINKLKDPLIVYQDKVSNFFDLKSRIGLPDQFLIVDGDNELLIDCNKEISIKTFLDLIKTRTNIVINEFLFSEDSSCVKDTEGNNFANEFIATVFNNDGLKNKINKIDTEQPIYSRRSFFLGSEWLFYKIYCGVKTADNILENNVKSIIVKLFALDLIDKWFFIRYNDPDPHVRLRLHLKNSSRIAEVLNIINNEITVLTEAKYVSKVIADTYSREIERYGDNSIDIVEQLFFNDSEFVIELLSRLKGHDANKKRWQIGILSINKFLDDFGLNLQQKYIFAEKLSARFFKEHNGDKKLKVSIDLKYRKYKSDIDKILNEEHQYDESIRFIALLLTKRSESNVSSINKILDLERNNELAVDLSDLLSSIIHMNLDRLFVSKNRANEFLLYELLFRHYKSKLVLKKVLVQN